MQAGGRKVSDGRMLGQKPQVWRPELHSPGRKSKEPALRKGLWVNPYGMSPFGIHKTGPALPFAKALRVNSFGIHENRT